MNSKLAFTAALLGLMVSTATPSGAEARVDTNCQFWYSWCGYGYRIQYRCDLPRKTKEPIRCGIDFCRVKIMPCSSHQLHDKRPCVASCCKNYNNTSRDVGKDDAAAFSTPLAGDYRGSDTVSLKSERKSRDVAKEDADFISTPFAGYYSGEDVVSFVDINQDGKLDELEVKIFTNHHGVPDETWRTLDLDVDNHFSAPEIDDQLVSGENILSV